MTGQTSSCRRSAFPNKFAIETIPASSCDCRRNSVIAANRSREKRRGHGRLGVIVATIRTRPRMEPSREGATQSTSPRAKCRSGRCQAQSLSCRHHNCRSFPKLSVPHSPSPSHMASTRPFRRNFVRRRTIGAPPRRSRNRKIAAAATLRRRNVRRLPLGDTPPSQSIITGS